MNGPNTRHIKLSRRNILAVAGIGAAAYAVSRAIDKWQLVSAPDLKTDENSGRGHLVRQEFVPGAPVSVQETGVLIIGSGISGLSTAYHLEKAGHKNYLILEADDRVGGNSANGKNDIGAFPLGAHYLPIVRNDDHDLLKFLEDIGIVTGFQNQLPVYKDEYLCAAPHERLFIKGRWQHESLIPQFAAGLEEMNEIKSFLNFVDGLRTQRGNDGRFVFSIPVEKSSRDPKWLQLDNISFREYLNQKNWRCDYLTWYTDYCCRDDFGLSAAETSAWAGLHYFSSRSGVAANAETQSVLTWPEGNGFLVTKLQAKISVAVQTKATVRQVVKDGSHYKAYFTDADGKTREVRSQKVVFAVPKIVASRIIPRYKPQYESRAQPWFLANMKIKREALEDKTPLCWDNVRYGTQTLGYINSSQQLTSQGEDFVNITFYHAFAGGAATEQRKVLAKMSETELLRLTLDEMTKMHPELGGAIADVQFKLIGHGMVGPEVGYLWGRRLKNIEDEPKDFIFAHTDRAGISIFEEGFHQGIAAAERVLRNL